MNLTFDSLEEKLPVSLWTRVVLCLMEQNERVYPLLTQCGRCLSQAATAALYHSIVLPDMDLLLLLASGSPLPSPLRTLMHSDDHLALVRRLTVVQAPTPCEGMGTFDLADLLSRAIHLESFAWSSNRPPPKLSHAIAELTQLTQFACSLAEQPAVTAHDLVPDPANRWNGETLAGLPSSLTTLSLGQLSSRCAKELTATLPRLPALKTVELYATWFVDNDLCAALGQSQNLTHLCIRQMAGSKVSDQGIHSLLMSYALESLELIEFEGRLSKHCWSKIDLADVSPSLRAISLSFNEAPNGQHSWCTSHLESIHAMLLLPHLQVFCIRRIPHAATYTAPRSSHPNLTVHELMMPRSLPKDLAEALMSGTPPKLTELGLDFYLVSIEQLQVLADTFRPSLETLHVQVADTVHRIFTLANNVPNMVKLRRLNLSVALPERVNYVPLKVAGEDPKESPGSVSLLPVLAEDVPAIKDVKKFLRKARQLQSVAWVGRMGYGTWFVRKAASVPKVEITEGILNEHLDRPRSMPTLLLPTAPATLAGHGLPTDPLELGRLCAVHDIEQRFVYPDAEEAEAEVDPPAPGSEPPSPVRQRGKSDLVQRPQLMDRMFNSQVMAPTSNDLTFASKKPKGWGKAVRKKAATASNPPAKGSISTSPAASTRPLAARRSAGAAAMTTNTTWRPVVGLPNPPKSVRSPTQKA